jgi:hypothetical protein
LTTSDVISIINSGGATVDALMAEVKETFPAGRTTQRPSLRHPPTPLLQKHCSSMYLPPASDFLQSASTSTPSPRGLRVLFSASQAVTVRLVPVTSLEKTSSAVPAFVEFPWVERGGGQVWNVDVRAMVRRCGDSRSQRKACQASTSTSVAQWTFRGDAETRLALLGVLVPLRCRLR